jgi:hypothetical protein
VDQYKPGDLAAILPGLQAPCIAERRLAIWALASVHDPAAVEPLAAYIAAHPDGDWLDMDLAWKGEDLNLVDLAYSAIAYIEAPASTTETYTIRALPVYHEVPALDAQGAPTGDPNRTLAPGTPLHLGDRVQPGGTLPDGTPVVFRQVRFGPSQTIYYLEVTMAPGVLPRYFKPPVEQ